MFMSSAGGQGALSGLTQHASSLVTSRHHQKLAGGLHQGNFIQTASIQVGGRLLTDRSQLLTAWLHARLEHHVPALSDILANNS